MRRSYVLNRQEAALLLPTSAAMASKLKYDNKNGIYNFNQDYVPVSETSQKSFGGPRIKAEIHADLQQGVKVSDPQSSVDFAMKPKFQTLGPAQQQTNRLVYPLENAMGHLVYTAQANGIKEDIALQSYSGEKLAFKYELVLGDSLAAKLLDDGSVGIYGSDLPISGNVSTGSAKDAQLLQKARQKAPKNTLLFTIPVPVVHESNRRESVVKALFKLDKNNLTVTATNLKKANYPLSIDPSLLVTSATEFFRDTNADTNIYFDTANNQMKRGVLTGGNLPNWSSTSNGTMGTSRFLHGTAVYAGNIYAAGGASTTTTAGTSVESSSLNTSSPYNTGTWTTTTALPAARARFQLVAYNGYLYAIGGTADTAGAIATQNIYYTRIQAGGQLDPTWTTVTNALPTNGKYSFGAAAYNGFLYVVGGKTGSANSTGSTDVMVCTLLPNGAIGSNVCVQDDTVLPAARYGHDVQASNGYLYVVGGNLNGTLTNTVLYAALNSDGTVSGTTSAGWKTASSFATARENFGATYTTVSNGYLYMSGGCKSVNASQTCNTAGDVMSDIQLAQINADGSLGSWFANAGGNTSTKVGEGIVSWRNVVYNVAGCVTMSAASIVCSSGANTLATQQYAVPVGPGDTSGSVSTQAIPHATFGHGVAVVGGFIYVIGGCNTATCDGAQATSYITSHAPINTNGTIGTWSDEGDATNTGGKTLNFADEGGNGNCTTSSLINAADQCGLAGMTVSVSGGYIYVIDGYNGAADKNTVYYMKPNTNGNINSWNTGSTTTISAHGRGSFAYNGFLYAIGGCAVTGSGIGCSNYQTTVEKASLSASTGAPGTWSTTSQLQLAAVGRALFATAFYGGFVYLAGGADNTPSAQLGTVLRAKVDSSNNIVAATGTVWTGTSGTIPVRRRTTGFAVNGYLYIAGGHDGTTGGNGVTLGDIQIGKIDLAGTGDITSFTASSGSFSLRWNPGAYYANGYLYVLGGCEAGPPPQGCTTIGSKSEYVQPYNADSYTTGAWANTSASPHGTNSMGAAVTAYNGYLYVFGGCTTYTITGSSCSAATSNSYYAKINADGTVGTWNSGPTITGGNAYGALVALNNRLYLIGGSNSAGTKQSVVQVSAIGASGSPGSLSNTTAGLSAARERLSAAVYNGYIYVTGGRDATSAVTTTSYAQPSTSTGDIASWTNAGNTFTNLRDEHATVAAAGYLYILGGESAGTYYNDVQYSKLDGSTGAPGTWAGTANLPSQLSFLGATAANGYIYAVGGRSAQSTCVTGNYTASIGGGTGGLGDWQQSGNNLTSARFGEGVASSNGYLYSIGGHDCSIILNASQDQYAGQLSPAIKGQFSHYLDFGGNATPRQTIINGTNFIINTANIDKWRLRYKSSVNTGSPPGWGEITTLSPITFATLSANLLAVDSSNVDMGVGQWWQLIFDIDMSQSFSFTEDTTILPTLTDYTFYYSPGGATRLRNGKTFHDQTQQSLDAHP